MTKQEARKILQGRLDLIEREGYPVNDYAGALRVAIKALGEDHISRKKALNHVKDVPYIKEHPNMGLLWEAWIKEL